MKNIDRFKEGMVKYEIDKAMKYATTRTLAVMLIALQDTNGFAKVRQQKVVSKFNYIIDCIDAGTVDIEELIMYCKEEFDIDLRG